MLLNLNEIKKADVITVKNGLVQAINGPVAYIGYLKNFDDLSFSVDAETLASALKDLEEDFLARVYDDKVIVFDSEREITFIPKAPEQLLTITNNNWIMRDLSHPWQTVDKFVNQQFPGIRVTEDYFETLSDQSIVRVQHHLSIDTLEHKSMVFAKCKVPSNVIAYSIYAGKLWLQYKDSNFIIINSLDIAFPNTDNYFKNPLRYTPIPNLKSKLIPCDKVKFLDNNLVLIKEGSARAIIENIEGRGEYDFKLFSKVVSSALSWQMTDTALFFSGNNFAGLIENVEHISI